MGGYQQPLSTENKGKPFETNNMELLKMTIGQATTATQINAAIIKEYASQATRGAFLLNGSAAVAVLTKQGGLGPEGGIVIVFCAAGAICAVLCSGFSYLAQNSYAKYSAAIFEDAVMFIGSQKPSPKRIPLAGNRLNYCSWALFSVSIVLFIAALVKAIPLFK